MIHIPENSDFSIHNLPFGIFSTRELSPRAGVAIGHYVIDLFALGHHAGFAFDLACLNRPYLNDFIALGKQETNALRQLLQQWIVEEGSVLYQNEQCWLPMDQVQMHLPIRIGDYTDFYASEEHARNVGRMFRDPDNALLPNWKHLPVAYHGRASSILPSGRSIYRPKGQSLQKDSVTPVYRASERLDFEVEMAFVVGKENSLGNPVSIENAEEYIFGLLLFNDWSARDIQKWEYVPLGPFLGKSFASSVSPWIVPLEALSDFRMQGPVQSPPVLPYLATNKPGHFDIQLSIGITPTGGKETIVSQTNFKNMYWSMAQQLAHHTSNGCNIRIGDLMASGTLSGREKNSYGSLLELSWGGKTPLSLNDGSTRTFLLDGDTVTLRGHGQKGGKRVGFGEVTSTILPAL